MNKRTWLILGCGFLLIAAGCSRTAEKSAEGADLAAARGGEVPTGHVADHPAPSPDADQSPEAIARTRQLEEYLIGQIARTWNSKFSIECFEELKRDENQVTTRHTVAYGKSEADFHCVTMWLDPYNKNPKVGEITAEFFVANGQALVASQTTRIPSNYYQGVPSIESGEDPPYAIHDYFRLPMCGVFAPGGGDRVSITDPPGSPRYTVEDGLDLLSWSNGRTEVRYWFERGEPVQLVRVAAQATGERLQFSGKYDSNGEGVLVMAPFEESFDLREFQFDPEDGRITSFSSWYEKDGGFHRWAIHRISRVADWPGLEGQPFELTVVQKPELDKVVVKGSHEEYVLRNGRIVRLVDDGARNELLRIRDRYRQANAKGTAETGQAGSVAGENHDIILDSYLRKSSSRHCGVYAALVACESLGREVEIETLEFDRYVSSLKGSSAEDVIRLLKENGLHGFVVGQADGRLFRWVNRWKGVAILHFGSSFQAEQVAHWAVYTGPAEGEGDGDARVVDLPRPEETISIAELLTDWDGTAIVVTRQPVTGFQRFLVRTGAVFDLSIASVALLGAVMVAPILSRKTRWSAAGTSVTLLVGLSWLASQFWTYTSPVGFGRNPFATDLIEARTIPKRATERMPKVTGIAAGDLLIDARTPADFHAGHLPGAVNLPIDFSVGELETVLAVVEKSGKRALVYCSSEDCGWASVVAAKLKVLGVNEVAVYEPGVRGYLQGMPR